MGRHTYFLARSAHEVVAVDLGDAIRVTADNIAGCQNVRLLQADIDYLPFRPDSFDFICSIGVLHHLVDPQFGFNTLLRCLRPGGTIHIYLGTGKCSGVEAASVEARYGFTPAYGSTALRSFGQSCLVDSRGRLSCFLIAVPFSLSLADDVFTGQKLAFAALCDRRLSCLLQ